MKRPPLIRDVVEKAYATEGSSVAFTPSGEPALLTSNPKPNIISLSPGGNRTRHLETRYDLRRWVADAQTDVTAAEFFNLSGKLIRTESFMAGPASYFIPGQSRTCQKVVLVDTEGEHAVFPEGPSGWRAQTPLGIVRDTLVLLVRNQEGWFLLLLYWKSGHTTSHRLSLGQVQGAQAEETEQGALVRVVSGPLELRFELDFETDSIRQSDSFEHGLQGTITPAPGSGWVVEENGEFALVGESRRVLFQLPQLLRNPKHLKPPTVRDLGEGLAILSFWMRSDDTVDNVAGGCRGGVVFSKTEVISAVHTELGEAFFGYRPGSKHYFTVVMENSRFDAGDIVAVGANHEGKLAALTSFGRVIWTPQL